MLKNNEGHGNRDCLVLAIETSCDDTSVAVVAATGEVKICLSVGQNAAHAPFGGIVPEIASRNHTFQLLPLVERALQECGLAPAELTGVAVTSRPGLMGSLIVGVVTAKTLAMSWQKPWFAINHLEGHLLAPFLRDSTFVPAFGWQQPFLALAVSGGHTALYAVESLFHYCLLGSTLDDAAGEAFDKFGKMLGLPFPGGVEVDGLSSSGDPCRYEFPRGLMHDETLNFSFSGLKSAAQRILSSMGKDQVQAERAHLCASFQEAVVEALMIKLALAQQQTGLQRIVVTGGVSANRCLRQKSLAWAKRLNLKLQSPPPRYCTDNAAMIGLAGALRLQNWRLQKMPLTTTSSPSPWTLAPSPVSLPLDFLPSPLLAASSSTQQKRGGALTPLNARQRLLKAQQELGLSPKRSLGQNFLVSDSAIDKIVGAAARFQPRSWIEIGPGLGALTWVLRPLIENTLLIELDSVLAQYWREQNVAVVEIDALHWSWRSLNLPRPCILVSNLPYQIAATLVIERCLDPLPLEGMVLMFQKEVAQRLKAVAGSAEFGFSSGGRPNILGSGIIARSRAPRFFAGSPGGQPGFSI